MAYPSLTFATLLDNATRSELEQFISLLQGYLSQQHDEDGAHTDITADSVTVTGDVAADGDGTFGGDVIARSDTLPVTIGGVGVGSAPGIRMQSAVTPTASDSDWAWVAGNAGVARQLSLRDVIEVSDVAMLDIIRTGTSAYAFRPHSGAITLTLGTDASSQRWSSVNAATLRASTVATAETFGWTGRSAPAQITSNQNDYAISSGAARVFINSDAARDITGIVAGFDGQLLWLINFGGFAITLKEASASSAAANRIRAAASGDVVLRASNGSALLQYDTASAFWYVLGA